jgi:hypothetical protein
MNAPDCHNSFTGDQQLVTSLQSTDVLVGRGSGPNDHEGNILFRSLVRNRKSEYMATNHRQTKTKIAREIIDIVLAQNGRFMKKIDPSEAKELGIPKGVDAYHPVDERTIMEKTKQALRQKLEKEGGDSPDHPSPETSPSRTLSIPPEISSHYAHETSNEAHFNAGYHTQMYAPNQRPFLHAPPRGAYLSEDDPPSSQMMAALGMAELDHERVAEMSVHRNSVLHGGDKEPGNVIDDEETRRQSLRVEDLIRSFHRVGTDEFSSSRANSSNSNSNQESNESMGTIEPLPMDASSFSMMSMSSILKGALSDTPRSSFTGHDGVARRDSGHFSCGGENSGYGRRSHYERDVSSRSVRPEMSMSLSHLDLSLVPEGKEGEEGAFKASLSFEPRPLELMVEQPDCLDEMGDSSKEFIKSALGKNGESLLFDASMASLSFEPRPVQLMEEHPDSLDEMGDSSKNLIQSALGKSGESSLSLDMHG